MDWIRMPTWPRTGISIVWKAILHTLPFIRSGLAWRINNGNQVRIGMDPWTGVDNMYQLPPDLIQYFQQRHIKVIAKIAEMEHSFVFEHAWLSAHNLEQWQQSWDEYINALIEVHVRMKEGPDDLIWTSTEHGKYSPNIGYLSLLTARKLKVLQNWWRIL